ncbi:hypothetical protein Molly5_19 [Maribacter phage Molly_5]|uniref:Uncharacterized protein n=2 Tax=Mollyvirus TaxID=2948826 RepID=A0A8E4UXX3_9CAUD|nr:hypothetical protein M1M29_gp019 [Maribacter phage Molly_1]YP_010357267.1 hypothetical protein M1M30_gp018 [Maribacter phage Colly_1]QQO97688.1 hypothetical protein Molly2_19 [Maribacter phage Molly_2]QQO97888.1 hypothetical protein Molly3_19 [Maribacter phage Molly_3]QQO98088.1 hypothetical protein Molly4_19 [Maribacter phage Molly_4]QQO98288.1 hypothetical protein Molly5_19 [Maribacter phage Molly_5]QQO97284.1 hypothetical protein Colly1_18 [Maribacter phage Colly_1]
MLNSAAKIFDWFKTQTARNQVYCLLLLIICGLGAYIYYDDQADQKQIAAVRGIYKQSRKADSLLLREFNLREQATLQALRLCNESRAEDNSSCTEALERAYRYTNEAYRDLNNVTP